MPSSSRAGGIETGQRRNNTRAQQVPKCVTMDETGD
jgi:hypothetical protein